MSGKSKPLTSEQIARLEKWDLPHLSEDGSEQVNAFGSQKRRIVEREKPLKPPTAEDIEAIRQSAYDAGFAEGKQEGLKAGHALGLESGHEEGKAQGLKEGRSLGEQAISEEIKRMQALVMALRSPITQEREALNRALVDAVIGLSRAVIARELAVSQDSLEHLVRQALSIVEKDCPSIDIYVHPQDSLILNETTLGQDGHIRWVTDDTLSQGGCRLETRSQWVDFSVEQRFKQASEQWLMEVRELITEDAQQSVSQLEDSKDAHEKSLAEESTQNASDGIVAASTNLDDHVDEDEAPIDVGSEESINRLLNDESGSEDEPF